MAGDPTKGPPIQSLTSKIARATLAGNKAAEDDARREVAEAKIRAHIERTLAAAPPLTDEQKARLVATIMRTWS